MHIEIAKCLIIFSGHCDLDIELVFRIISSILYKEGIPNGIWRNPKFGIWMHLEMTKRRAPSLGPCDIDLDL